MAQIPQIWQISIAQKVSVKHRLPWGPFLECPGNFLGPKSNLQIEI